MFRAMLEDNININTNSFKNRHFKQGEKIYIYTIILVAVRRRIRVYENRTKTAVKKSE